MIKVTQQHAKRQNTRLILRELYQQGELSRADIARRTQLTRPTVSSLVSDLIAENLVMEQGLGESTGGKRPVLLTIADDAPLLLCVDIGNQLFRGALLDLHGDSVYQLDVPATALQGDDALQKLYDLIDPLLAQAARPVIGLAVGTPGLIDHRAGVVRRAVNLDWRDVPLRDLLAQSYDLPIYLANDSHVAALAEHLFGTEQDNVILLKTGQGIGAGIVWNGAMLAGDGFGAGEIGQVVVAERDGQLLTLEQVASTRAILQRGRELVAANLTWEQIFESEALPVLLDEVGHHLGVAVANLIATLNIHHIVITGRLTQFGDPLLEKIHHTARRYMLNDMVDDTTLRFSELGEQGVLLGCSALLLKHELGIF